MRNKRKYDKDYYQKVRKPRFRKLYEKPCPVCGKLMYTKGATKCRSCHNREHTRENSTHWKGGRFQASNGYINTLKPDHPRANNSGYVKEHILVWEETHNKAVPKGWVVHHLNGVKNDNRPENLLAVPRDKHEHGTLVKVLQSLIRELEQRIIDISF